MAIKSGTLYVLAMLAPPAVLALFILVVISTGTFQAWQARNEIYHPQQWQLSLSKLETRAQVEAWQQMHFPEAPFHGIANFKGYDLISTSTEGGSSEIHFLYDDLQQENPQIEEIRLQFTSNSGGLLFEQETIYPANQP